MSFFNFPYSSPHSGMKYTKKGIKELVNVDILVQMGMLTAKCLSPDIDASS
jgi:hypothetical protein|tara:strand:- start:334 stop:486 length:153 start_codon:yes stop_codon:yes gene_type:complete